MADFVYRTFNFINVAYIFTHHIYTDREPAQYELFELTHCFFLIQRAELLCLLATFNQALVLSDKWRETVLTWTLNYFPRLLIGWRVLGHGRYDFNLLVRVRRRRRRYGAVRQMSVRLGTGKTSRTRRGDRLTLFLCSAKHRDLLTDEQSTLNHHNGCFCSMTTINFGIRNQMWCT